MEPSGLYSEGKAKVKTVMSMGKESEIKVSEIPRAHKRYSIVDAVQSCEQYRSTRQTWC